MKTYILIVAAFFIFAAGCSSIKTTDDAGMLKVDAGDDKTAFVGETVDFEGSCIVKAGFFQRDASWDFGDGSGEDGMQATHVYTSPGDYTAELTVSIVYLVTFSVSDDLNVKINPLPADAFLSEGSKSPEDADEHVIANQLVTFLPDGRMALVGTTDAEDPSEIAVAMETEPGSRLLRHVTDFVQYETGSFPDDIKALDNENIKVISGAVQFNICLINGAASTSSPDVTLPKETEPYSKLAPADLIR
jgi:PKD repeat protein